MIIGNGLIAQAFNRKKQDFSGSLILASGVSNSKETRLDEFSRERKLILGMLSEYPEKKIIYFSTASIYSEFSTPYIKHKLEMESIIRKKSENHLIIRLGNVVTLGRNSTMIPYFISRIRNNEVICVQLNATRQIAHIDDVVSISSLLIEQGAYGVFNIASKYSYKVVDIVRALEQEIKCKAALTFTESGDSYEIPTQRVSKLLPNHLINSEEYLRYTIRDIFK